MLRKSIVNGMAAAIFLAIILLNSLSIVSANEPSIRVNVYARAKNGDLIVSGKVFLRGLESGCTINVRIIITARRPDGYTGTQIILISGEIRSNGVTILSYGYTFEGFVNKRGIYEIEVKAECDDLSLSDTAFFKFDPPTGGTPGVPC